MLKIIWANGYMLNRRGRQAPQQDLSNPVFSQKNCIQESSNCGSTQISLKTHQILTDSLLPFGMSASACLIQHLAPTKVSRGCQITHSSTKVLNRDCLNRFHNAHNSLRTRLCEYYLHWTSAITQLLIKNWWIYKQKYLYIQV